MGMSEGEEMTIDFFRDTGVVIVLGDAAAYRDWWLILGEGEAGLRRG
jgi:hypothetical protein